MWAQKLFLFLNTNKQYCIKVCRVIYSLKGQFHEMDIFCRLKHFSKVLSVYAPMAFNAFLNFLTSLASINFCFLEFIS
jgi:hypothetical protein